MLTIREGRPEDADDLAAAHLEGWRVGYRGVVSDTYLDSSLFADSRATIWRAWNWNVHGRSGLFVAELDGRPVGFGLCGPERVQSICDQQTADESGFTLAPRGEVYSFYLHPDSWGSGAAPAMIVRCEEWLAEQGFSEAVLWVLRDNPRGRAFYEKAGWTPTGRELTFEIGGDVGDPHPLVEVEYATTLR